MDRNAPLASGWTGNIEVDCTHRWRVMPQTQDGYSECQHCGVMVELKWVIDALLVAAQPE